MNTSIWSATASIVSRNDRNVSFQLSLRLCIGAL